MRVGVVIGVSVGATVLAIGASPMPTGSLPTRLMPTAVAAPRDTLPNFLVVLADDLATGDEAFMPHTSELVADAGAVFENYFVSDSVCCPSRVTTLRGQFAHNTGVKTNGGGNGGFNTAYLSGVEHDTIATRLQGAGYRTGLFGKYLNRYPGIPGDQYIPPGWSEWSSPVRGNPYRQRDYTLNHNGKLEAHGDRPSDHADTVFVDQTVDFVSRAARDGVPFFAFLTVYAPHTPAHPAAVDRHDFAGETAPRDAAYNQADVSRMPQYVRALPRFTSAQQDAIDRLYRRRLQSLQAVDRGVARLVDTLRTAKQLANTYIVFTSDNGFHLGDHRLPGGKGTPYDTDIKVPLMVRGPGIEAGTRVERFAGNVDLTPTIAELAHTDAPAAADGRSLVPLLRDTPTARWRARYLVEHWQETGDDGAPLPPPSSRATWEPRDADAGAASAGRRASLGSPYGSGPIDDQALLAAYGRIPDYHGVRTRSHLYVEYANGDRELYDVRSDPAEVHNLVTVRPRLAQRLAAELARLRDCRDASCRAAERGSVAAL